MRWLVVGLLLAGCSVSGQPDAGCLWLVDSVGQWPPCLVDTEPPLEPACVKMTFIYEHQVRCAPRERLVGYLADAGVGLCERVSPQCGGTVQ